jgi:GT2 family glycosyltransferase
MWWAAAINAGVETAQALGCKWVITYNDDNLATPNLFSNLAAAGSASPGSIIAAVCCYADDPSKVFFAGRMRAKGTDRFYYLDHNASVSSLGTGLRHAEMLHGMCTLFPISVFESVGLCDAQTFPQAFADDDLLLRARRAGFSLVVALDAVVLNDRTKTGLNPYDRRLGPTEIVALFSSRRSNFQLHARTRFLWKYRRDFYHFAKTWICDYSRLLALIVSRRVLPVRTFQSLGALWNQRLQEK